MDRRKLVLVGGGGHCRSAIDVIESTGKFSIIAILDLPDKLGQPVLSFHINGTEDQLAAFASEGADFAVTIGQTRNAEPRVRAFDKIMAVGGSLPVIASRFAVISVHSVISAGSMVFHGAVVNAGATIGCNTILNTGSLVEHDSVVGDHTHISTRAVVNGGCRIGSRCFIGSGAIIKEGISICDDVVIGAGALVTRHITEPGLYFGVPAKRNG
jgi:sugar O-acyltransferase (sialic acid O-acetyltransferase NeuD family)